MGSVFAFDNGHEFAKVYVLYYGGRAVLVCNVIKCCIILFVCVFFFFLEKMLRFYIASLCLVELLIRC